MLSNDDQLVLNELMVLHGRALAVYLTYAAPWVKTPGRDAGADIVRDVASSHLSYSDEVGEMLLSADVAVVSGDFPMAYTGYHDLGIEFLLQKVVASEKATLTRLEGCAKRASDDRVKAIAERSVGATKAHLQELDEYLASTTI